MSFFLPSATIAWRTVVAVACLLAMWNSWKLMRADFLFRQDTAGSIHSAIRLASDDPRYYMRLAQLDEGHGEELLEAALKLNPYNAQAAIELGLLYEAKGNNGRAERLLLQASAVDHTYLPRWSLANFYLRRNNIPEFWTWARRAAAIPAEDVGALFVLCWRVSPDPGQISTKILTDNPQLNGQYLRFLLEKDEPRAITASASRLIHYGNPETDRPLLLVVVDRLIARDQPGSASALWQELSQQHWVVADTTSPNNAAFARDPLPVSFDWAVASYRGLATRTGPSGLVAEFTGVQPEDCSIAEQSLVLAPGSYTMKYSYRTADIRPDTGIRWQIVDVKSGTVLADSSDLSSDSVTHTDFGFAVGPDAGGASLLRLRLIYRRAPGTSRIAGSLVVLSTGIEAGRSV
jgi:tetratricopeptide (TPR) repeat protein